MGGDTCIAQSFITRFCPCKEMEEEGHIRSLGLIVKACRTKTRHIGHIPLHTHSFHVVYVRYLYYNTTLQQCHLLHMEEFTKRPNMTSLFPNFLAWTNTTMD